MKKTHNFFRFKIILFVFILSSAALQAQEWFRGKLYLPLPLPDPQADTSGRRGSGTPVFCVWDSIANCPKLLPTDFQNEADSMSPSNIIPGLPSEEFVADRNFSNLQSATSVTTYPRSCMVKLFMDFPNGLSYVGSGTLINSRWVLTAGHCVFDNTLGGNATKIKVVPAYSNGVDPFGEANMVGLPYATNLWLTNHDYNWDLGLIKLDRCIGGLTGWLGYGYGPNSDFNGKTYNNYSYPASQGYDGAHMWYQSGTFDEIYNRTVYYHRGGIGGQSGSGMYYKTSDGYRIVKAVLSHGNQSVTGSVRLESNSFESMRDLINGAKPNTRNLTPLWSRISESSVIAGCDHLGEISFLLHNYSEAAYNGNVSVKVKLSEGSSITTSDRTLKTKSLSVNLAADESAWFSISDIPIPANVAGGSYYIGVYLDISDGLGSDNGQSGDDVDRLYVAPARYLELPIQNFLTDADAQCLILDVESNTDWLLSWDWSDDWILSVTPDYGSGSAAVQICLGENNGVRSRQAVLTMTGQCVSGQTIEIGQDFSGIHVFPNPVSENATLTYHVTETVQVRITLYSADGKELSTLVDGLHDPGDYTLSAYFGALPGGVYFLQMETGQDVFARRFVKL